MYSVQTITEALRGLVGFRQHNDESIANDIDEDLATSRSGLWLDRAHPLITAQVLIGAAVLLNSVEDEDPLSALIKQALDDSVADVLSALRTRKLLRYEAKTILPNTMLFEGEGSISDLIQPAGRFVGLRLTGNDPELAIGVRSIGLQFTFPVSGLKIYVAKGYANPVLAQTINTTYSGRMQWFDSDIVLSGSDSYVIGYYENDLGSSQAVRRNKTIGQINCPGCEPTNDNLWQRWKPYISVQGVRKDSDTVPFDEFPQQNFGMNLAIAMGCDIGPFIIAQQANMAEAIRQQAVVKLLSEIAYSTQITTIEQQTRQNALYALESTELSKLNKLLDALDIDFSGLSDRCMPDTRSSTMPTRGTVFRRPR